MIKKTFFTLKQSPSVFLATAVPFVLIGMAMIPLVFVFNNFIENFIAQTGNFNSTSSDMITRFFIWNYLFVAIVFILEIAAILLAVPVIMNRIYELCSGVNQPGWIKRGLSRCWWKPLVTGIILYMCAFVLVFSFILFFINPILGGVTYTLVLLAYYVLGIIAFTSVIAEDDFGAGISRIFTVGGKYFLKMAGVLLLTLIPLIAGYAVGFFVLVRDSFVYSYTQTAMQMQQFMDRFFIYLLILVVVMGIYSIFALPFIYTYSMNQYLYNRGLTYPDSASDIRPDETNQQKTGN